METKTKVILGVGALGLVLIPTYNILTSIIVDAAIIACLWMYIRTKF